MSPRPSAREKRCARTHPGRHTLGNTQDSGQGSTALASGAAEDAPEAPGTHEPKRTIYEDWWKAAQNRLAAVDEDARPLLARLLQHVERGWRHVRELQLLCEQHQEQAINDAFEQLLDFIAADVVDLFRTVAQDAAVLVPPEGGRWSGNADIDGMAGEAERFTRYATVLGLAAGDKSIPLPARQTIQRAVSSTASWSVDLTELVTRIADLWLGRVTADEP